MYHSPPREPGLNSFALFFGLVKEYSPSFNKLRLFSRTNIFLYCYYLIFDLYRVIGQKIYVEFFPDFHNQKNVIFRTMSVVCAVLYSTNTWTNFNKIWYVKFSVVIQAFQKYFVLHNVGVVAIKKQNTSLRISTNWFYRY